MFASTKRQNNSTTESSYSNARWLTSITVRRVRLRTYPGGPCHECHCYRRCCGQAKAWGLRYVALSSPITCLTL